MPVSTPISGMSLLELRRSFILAVQEWEGHISSLMGRNVSVMSDEEVEAIVHQTITMRTNLELGIARIEVLELDMKTREGHDNKQSRTRKEAR